MENLRSSGGSSSGSLAGEITLMNHSPPPPGPRQGQLRQAHASVTSQSSLTVPDVVSSQPGPGKVNRATSPLNFKARLKKRREKKLEKQGHLSDDMGCSEDHPEGANPFKSHQATNLPSPLVISSTNTGSGGSGGGSSHKGKFKELRKKSKESVFSLSFSRKNSKGPSSSHHQACDHNQVPCVHGQAPGTGGCSSNSLSPRSRSGDSFQFDSLSPYPGTSPELRSPRSPTSPGQCRCRRCSLLPLEECEPKEMNALFKFLRKSKVTEKRKVSQPVQHTLNLAKKNSQLGKNT